MTIPLLAQRWIDLEIPYAVRYHHGSPEPNQVRRQIRQGGLLITAPHAVHHYRSSTKPDKASDIYTGGLCELLAESLGVSAVAANSRLEPWNEWSERSDDFKKVIDDALAAGNTIIDLHGMSNTYGVDICIGLGPQPTDAMRIMAERLQTALSPLKVALNRPFRAQHAYTITSYVQTQRGNALQIEIARHLRDPDNDPDTAAKFADQMIQALQTVTHELTRSS